MKKEVDRKKVRDKLNFQFPITICTHKIIICQEENYTKKENGKRQVIVVELEEKEHEVQIEKRVEDYMHPYSGNQICC